MSEVCEALMVYPTVSGTECLPPSGSVRRTGGSGRQPHPSPPTRPWFAAGAGFFWSCSSPCPRGWALPHPLPSPRGARPRRLSRGLPGGLPRRRPFVRWRSGPSWDGLGRPGTAVHAGRMPLVPGPAVRQGTIRGNAQSHGEGGQQHIANWHGPAIPCGLVARRKPPDPRRDVSTADVPFALDYHSPGRFPPRQRNRTTRPYPVFTRPDFRSEG